MYSLGSSSYVCRTSPRQLLNNSLYRFFILPSQKDRCTTWCTGLSLLLSEINFSCLSVHIDNDRQRL